MRDAFGACTATRQLESGPFAYGRVRNTIFPRLAYTVAERATDDRLFRFTFACVFVGARKFVGAFVSCTLRR